MTHIQEQVEQIVILLNAESNTNMENESGQCKAAADDSISISEGSSEADDLTLELQKSFPNFYNTESQNDSMQSCSSQSNDEELQASALCQFMDILNDLDDVLDKSLLARLDDGTKTVGDVLELDSIQASESKDIMIKNAETENVESPVCHTLKDNNPIAERPKLETQCTNESQNESIEFIDTPEIERVHNATFRRNKPLRSTFNIRFDSSYSTNEPINGSRRLGRVRSASDLTLCTDYRKLTGKRHKITDNLRLSMRHLEPVDLPTPVIEVNPTTCEQLTLPVILFLEHHMNLRPNSAPIQLQLTASNVNNTAPTAPIIIGRRALLMNRNLSLQATVNNTEEVNRNIQPSSQRETEWETRSSPTSRRSRTRRSSTSSSSESGESISNIPPLTPRVSTSTTDQRSEDTFDSPLETWPHRLSSMLACLSCTVGIFNISRFSIFSVHFGANFIVQFFILSLLMGIPLFTLQLCLGQMLAAGPMDMWKISPLFQGVGMALLLAQTYMGVYSIVGISWMFIYFRDSFITKDDHYRWSLPSDLYRDSAKIHSNATFKISETIPDYFNGVVLQRYNLAMSEASFGTIKFQVAFNLAVVWMIVFVALSKGLRSYGKAVYVLMFLPICGTLVLCIKLLTLAPNNTVSNIFSETVWSEFFINSKSWSAAAQETFLTWGLLGACIMQLASHNDRRTKTESSLQKECACVVAFTFAILLLAAFLANTCVQILKFHGYLYLPASYEDMTTYTFLRPTTEPLPRPLAVTPVRYMGHYASLMGIHVTRPETDRSITSGYQVLQLATELVPSTLAVIGTDQLSPFWAVLFYFILIVFGIAQQLAVWHSVITGIIAIKTETLKSWETTITFFSCVCGLLLGLPLTTDAGIRIIHYLDYVVVGMWWHLLLYVVLIVGVFVVRGRPYSGDIVVTALYATDDEASKCSITLASLLSFTWNVILPVVMIALCIIDFRLGRQVQLYWWRRPARRLIYWPLWSRQLGVAMQQTAVLAVPIIAVWQTWRYMNSGPTDILERIQNLYRPRLEAPSEVVHTSPARSDTPPPLDPPPKYTPPPSYSTATGTRLAKAFRHTIRRSVRSVRRLASSIVGEASGSSSTQLPVTLSESVQRTQTHLLPPDYEEARHSFAGAVPTITITSDDSPPPSRRPLGFVRRSASNHYPLRSNFQPGGGAHSFRSSLRRSMRMHSALTTSSERLVPRAEPMSSTAALGLPAGRRPTLASVI